MVNFMKFQLNNCVKFWDKVRGLLRNKQFASIFIDIMYIDILYLG